MIRMPKVSQSEVMAAASDAWINGDREVDSMARTIQATVDGLSKHQAMKVAAGYIQAASFGGRKLRGK